MKALRAAIYTRVSTGEQTQGTSLETQELACLRRAAELGAQVTSIHRDPAVSGTLFLARPGIQAALSDIESGKANVLLMAKLDRSGRDVDVMRLIRRRVEAAGARLLFADGTEFASNAVGNLMFTQMAGFAEYEKEMIRERTMTGRRRRVELGLQPARAKPPYGYHIPTSADVLAGRYLEECIGKYQVIEEQAAIVREMFERYAAGESLFGVCRWLNSTGTPTAKGAPYWRIQSLRCILRNPVFKGEAHCYSQRRGRDEGRMQDGLSPVYMIHTSEEEHVIIKAPAIVSPELWERCQERLKTSRALHGGNPTRRFFLSTLLRCPECGRGLVGSTFARKGKRYRYYRCSESSSAANEAGIGCCTKHYPADEAESAVLRGVEAAVRQPALAAQAIEVYRSRQPIADTQAQVMRVERELKALEEQERAAVKAQIAGIGQGADPAIYADVFAALSQRRSELQQERAGLQYEPAPVAVTSPKSDAEALSLAMADVQKVLHSETVSPSEKHRALTMVFREIIPSEGRYTAKLLSHQGETLHCMGIHCSVSGEVTFEVFDAPHIRVAA